MSDDAAPYALVVDDEPLILMDACDILSDAGFRPLEAGRVDEAIGIIEAHAGDITLVFTDVQMPGGGDGFNLAREVARRWPDIRTLVASGAARPGKGDLPETAVFISKPFSADVVHERLQELLPDGRKPEPLRRAAQTG
jgi:CheY-like chemotaxis protein